MKIKTVYRLIVLYRGKILEILEKILPSYGSRNQKITKENYKGNIQLSFETI